MSSREAAGVQGPTASVSRRTVLGGVATGATALAVPGCLGLGDVGSTGATDDVVLDAPDEYETLSNAEVEYLIHGDQLPDVTVPDPLADRDVSIGEFVGERHVLVTFVFTRCTGVCPGLTAALRQVQADAADEGYADEVALLAVTFDPAYDTPERLETYADELGVDLAAGNWHFLRPESPARAEEVVHDRFGVYFEELSEDEREEMGMGEQMAFQHRSVIYLANADGYVERAYVGDVPTPKTVVDDVHTLRERW